MTDSVKSMSSSPLPSTPEIITGVNPPLKDNEKIDTIKKPENTLLHGLDKKSPRKDKPFGLSRVFNPPKLERKDSVGDLHSRLKTRKILGVGETDNGDIHRSKISQVLGHNEHLYVRLPRGFWTTHVVIGIGVTLEALLLLLTPTFASSIGLFPPPVLEEGDASHSSVALRLAGAALAGLSVFVWSVLGTTDKHYARTVLLACITYHVINMCLAGSVVIFQGGLGENRIGAGVGLRTIICLLCLIYFQQIVGYAPIRGQRPPFSGQGMKNN